MELEQGKNVDFWRDMTTITEDEISKLRKLEASGKGPGRTPVTLFLSNGFSPDMILSLFFFLITVMKVEPRLANTPFHKKFKLRRH